MQGLMMETPLLISSLIEHAGGYHADTEIVTRTVEGPPIHRHTYRDAHGRSRKLAKALAALGVGQGERIATLAWNTNRHFEVYYAVSSMGAVCHTINPRLFPPQIVYIVNQAEDSYVFVDLTFLPLLEGVADQLASLKGIVVMTDPEHMPATKLQNVMCYELLISDNDDYAWPVFDESTVSSLCYTSGTTGNPKGVDITPHEIIAFYDGKIAKWWTPDEVIFVDELPHTATGKLLKTQLREDFKDHKLPIDGG